MFRKEEIIFRKHTVLKADTLSHCCVIPLEVMELLYADQSDGIVSGGKIVIEKGRLCIMPGIIRYEGRLYQMTNPEYIPYEANGKEMKLKIRFAERKENEYGICYESDFLLTESEEERATDMELARFCLQEGAELRDKYQNFADMGTYYNTLNLLHVPYSAYGMAALSPVITMEYAKEAKKCAGANDTDFAFLIECLRGQPVNRSIILAYIQRKLEVDISSQMSNLQIFEYLKKILEKIRTAKKMNHSMSGRRVLID